MNINDDLYEILGVSSDASDDDIKKEYRKLAKEFHPDRNQGDKESEERFKRISAAYDILGDSEKRSQYDLRRKFSGDPRASQEGNPFFHGFSPFADMMFNRMEQNKPYVKNMNVSIALDVYSVANGKELTLDLPVDECCEECGGTGNSRGAKETRCHRCSGTGNFRTVNGNVMFSITCPDCRGKGKTFDRCDKCGGAGVISKSKKVELKVPKGIRDGSAICMRGIGHFSPGTKVRGDVTLRVSIKEHDFFKLMNEDVHVQIPVKFKDLILGAQIKVPSLYGDAVLNVPPESQNGSVFRLSGMGVQVSPNDQSLGDMFVHVIVDMPKGISSDFKERIRGLDDSLAEYEMSKLHKETLLAIERERKID